MIIFFVTFSIRTKERREEEKKRLFFFSYELFVVKVSLVHSSELFVHIHRNILLKKMKSATFALYKPFIDAYLKGHPDVAKVVCNSLTLKNTITLPFFLSSS